MDRLALITLLLAYWASYVQAQNFEPLISSMGGTLCTFLVYKGALHRKHLKECYKPFCTWNDWQQGTNHSSEVLVEKSRIVVSYGHNGFGNQLWEHSVAFMIAASLKARLLISVIPDSLSPGGFIPPNTWAGMGAMEHLLPENYEYESLSPNSTIRQLCDAEQFFISDRPVDWRNKNYSANFRSTFYDLITDTKPRCLKLLGYFQNFPLCADDARRLWTSRLLANVTARPGENDISIYLRCIPRHYHFNDKHFYESILNNTKFDNVWLFTAPECPTKLSDNPSKDGLVASVVRLLTTKYNATKWPQYSGPDENLVLLNDLAGLITSKKLILPVSSWAFWAGLLSNATEIHVNAPPIHPLMTEGNYVYHHEKAKLYFGHFNSSTGDIDYEITPPETKTQRSRHLRYSNSQSDSIHSMSEHVDTLYHTWVRDYQQKKHHDEEEEDFHPKHDSMDDLLFSMLMEGRFSHP